MRYAIVIEKANDGGFCTYVPDLPGCVGMGTTKEEAIENIIEGIKFHLDGLKEEGLPIPKSITEVENLVFEYAA
ncbi:MAG: type II toxin-antitoxin system HicB family antitoxin [Bacteroidia bacterium]